MSFKKILPAAAAAALLLAVCSHDFNNPLDPLNNGDNQGPHAQFTITPNPADVGVQITFNAASTTDPDGNLTEMEARWDFDNDGNWELGWDGFDVRGQVNHQYSAAGTYRVVLEVKDAGGLTDRREKDIVVNASSNQQPTAQFSANPNPADAGATITFDASASSDPDGNNTDLQVRWDFDNNNTWEFDWGTWAANKTVTHSYNTAGSYTVVLQVKDLGGSVGERRVTVTVNAGGSQSIPFAHFTLNPKFGEPVNTTFTLDASGSKDESGGTSLQYFWKFKASQSSWDGPLTNTVKTFVYGAGDVGKNTITLQVRDTGTGGIATATVQTTVAFTGAVNLAPTPIFMVNPARGTTSTQFTVDATASTDPDAADIPNLQYAWDFGDGSGQSGFSSNTTAQKQYNISGPKTIQLVVKDSGGRMAVASLQVYVE